MRKERVEFKSRNFRTSSSWIRVGQHFFYVTAETGGRQFGKTATLVTRSESYGPKGGEITDNGDYYAVRAWTLKGAMKQGARKFAANLDEKRRG